MKLSTYLNYGGNCADAFHFYEQHLGGKILMMMKHGETPGGSSLGKELHQTILHATIVIGGQTIQGADVPPSRFQPMRSAYLSLAVDSDAEAEKTFGLLSEGGEIFIPMQETFFASRFAMLRDKFGTSWMLLHQKPMEQNG